MKVFANWMYTARFIRWFCSWLLIASQAHGQHPADSTARAHAIQWAQDVYQSATRGNAPVFNGIQFIDPLQKKKWIGHPYFLSDDWIDGSVYYDGQRYQPAVLRYHLYLNKLVIDHAETHVAIELPPEKVKYFELDNHRFVRMPDAGVMKEGYYELLYDGHSPVYARRYKTIREFIDQKTLFTEFSERQRLYVVVNQTPYLIPNKKSALRLFEKHRQELKQALADQKIRYRQSPALALVAMARKYDELTP
jgi:hypothetical protein